MDHNRGNRTSSTPRPQSAVLGIDHIGQPRVPLAHATNAELHTAFDGRGNQSGITIPAASTDSNVPIIGLGGVGGPVPENFGQEQLLFLQTLQDECDKYADLLGLHAGGEAGAVAGGAEAGANTRAKAGAHGDVADVADVAVGGAAAGANAGAVADVVNGAASGAQTGAQTGKAGTEAGAAPRAKAAVTGTENSGKTLCQLLRPMSMQQAQLLRLLTPRQAAAIAKLLCHDDLAVGEMILSLFSSLIGVIRTTRIVDTLGDAVAVYLDRIPLEGPEYFRTREMLRFIGPRDGITRSRTLIDVLLRRQDLLLVSEITHGHPRPLFSKGQVRQILELVHDPEKQAASLCVLKAIGETIESREWACEEGALMTLLTIAHTDNDDRIRRPAMQALRSLLQGPDIHEYVTELVREKGSGMLLEMLLTSSSDVQRDVEYVLVVMFQWLDPDEPEREAFYNAVLKNRVLHQYLVSTRSLWCNVMLAWLLVEHPEATTIDTDTIVEALENRLKDFNASESTQIQGQDDMIDELIEMLTDSS